MTDNITAGRDVVVYNGKQYREVERKANVGELVKVVAAKGSDFKIGNVHKVIDDDYLWPFSERDETAVQVENCTAMFHWRYVTLEPINTDIDTTPIDDTTDTDHADLRQMVLDLMRRVDALEGKLGTVDGDLTTQIDDTCEWLATVEARTLAQRAIEAVYGEQQSYTREQVVAMAKADVEKLREGRTTYGVTDSDGTPWRCESQYIVNREKRTVVCLVRTYRSNWVVSRGIAKCDPEDVFNVHIGKAIALRRALGLDVPNTYTDAPQPTEAQVGDVIEIYGYQIYKVTAIPTLKDDELSVYTANSWLTGTMAVCGGNARIIDDSDREVM